MSQTFVLRNRQIINRCIAFISALGMADKSWLVTIKPYIKNRSLAQNRCFHAFVAEIAKSKGYSSAEMKILIKHHLGLHEYVTNKKTGEIIPSLRSTSDMDTEEFALLITQTETLAARDGITLERDHDWFEAMGLDPVRGERETGYKGVIPDIVNTRSSVLRN